jgi:phosphoribosyl-AMP cyclohydrolase / phosphoribosyl-ATP pyrophosphohydrolase
MISANEIKTLKWNKTDGLLPAIIQDSSTLQVLMLGYMNNESLQKTIDSGLVTFYSRSKKRLWTKGEESGNSLSLCDIKIDCDSDSLLITVTPKGPTCHTGQTSCFSDVKAPGIGFISHLNNVIEQRYNERPEGSYTTKLFNEGIDRMAQKVGEEAVETVIASKNNNKELFLGEAADLIYHLLVLLKAKGCSIDDVTEALRKRHS